MSRIVRVKNNMLTGGTWAGVSLAAGTYYTLTEESSKTWAEDTEVFASVGSGDLVINKGADATDDIVDPIGGWNWLIGDTMPKSSLGNILAVHSSTKPVVPGKEFYLAWTGAGDDVVNGIVGGGNLLAFAIASTDTTIEEEIRFDPQFGDVFIHEAYAKWYHPDATPGAGDNMSVMIMSDPSALQQVANLDLVVDVDGWITYAPGGPGSGTHGFAATPNLVPRTFSKDGDWDYDANSATPLTPNVSGTGGYKISNVKQQLHKYINRLPMCFSSAGYDRLTSDETAFLPPGYYIHIVINNVSATDWNCAFMFEVYRERTI